MIFNGFQSETRQVNRDIIDIASSDSTRFTESVCNDASSASHNGQQLWRCIFIHFAVAEQICRDHLFARTLQCFHKQIIVSVLRVAADSFCDLENDIRFIDKFACMVKFIEQRESQKPCKIIFGKPDVEGYIITCLPHPRMSIVAPNDKISDRGAEYFFIAFIIDAQSRENACKIVIKIGERHTAALFISDAFKKFF